MATLNVHLLFCTYLLALLEKNSNNNNIQMFENDMCIHWYGQPVVLCEKKRQSVMFLGGGVGLIVSPV